MLLKVGSLKLASHLSRPKINPGSNFVITRQADTSTRTLLLFNFQPWTKLSIPLSTVVIVCFRPLSSLSLLATMDNLSNTRISFILQAFQLKCLHFNRYLIFLSLSLCKASRPHWFSLWGYFLGIPRHPVPVRYHVIL